MWSVKCKSVKCGVWRLQREIVKCDLWTTKCRLLGAALQRESLCVMASDKNSATGSHKARAHGSGCRTAHASSNRWKRSYRIAIRQLPPRLVRALLVISLLILLFVSSWAGCGTVEMSVLWGPWTKASNKETSNNRIPMSIERVRFDPPRIVDLLHPWNLGHAHGDFNWKIVAKSRNLG